jgi:hypothetical protein
MLQNCEQDMSQSHAADTMQDVTTPHSPVDEPVAQHADPPATETKRPILVVLDDTPNQSEENNMSGEPRTRTPESHTKRVHSQPRQRVVPCVKKLLGVASADAIEETSAGATPTPRARATKYKDPPGYSDARDFGVSEEPYYRPPLLQPKNHGVRTTLNLSGRPREHCVLLLFVCSAVGLRQCAAIY